MRERDDDTPETLWAEEPLFRVDDDPESDAPLSVYMEQNDHDPIMRGALSDLAVGQSVTLGGGAWAEFVIMRVR